MFRYLQTCFLLCFVLGCSKLNNDIESSGSTVLPGVLHSISIEDSSSGDGASLVSIDLDTGTSFILHAIYRSSTKTFIENVEVSWVLEGNIGNLVILSGGKSARFDALTTGEGIIKVSYLGYSEVLLLTVTDNVMPIANQDEYYVEKDGTLVSLDVLTNDTHLNNEVLSLMSYTQGANGTVADNGDGSVSYTPNLNFQGTDSFTYVLSDEKSTTAQGTVILHVVTPHTWVGQGADEQWNTAENWCGNTLSGVCTHNLGAPSGTETAVFDANCTSCNVKIFNSISVNGINMSSEYSGEITQEVGGSQVEEMTLNADWIQNGGTFIGGDAAIDINGNFSLSSGSFTSTAGVLEVGVSSTIDQNIFNVSAPGLFLHNSGTVLFDAGRPWACGETIHTMNISDNLDFYNIVATGRGSGCGGGDTTLKVISGSPPNVLNNFDIKGAKLDGVWNLFGDLTNTGNFWGNRSGAGIIRIVGSQNQTIDGGVNQVLPILEVASTGGTVAFTGNLRMSNILYTSGVTDMMGSTVTLYHTSNLSIDAQNFNFDNLRISLIYCSTLSLVSPLNVVGNFSLLQVGDINGSAIAISGDLTINNSCTSYGGTTSLRMLGASLQSLAYLGGSFPTGLFEIDNTAGSLLTTNFPFSGIGHNLTIIDGTLDLSSFDVTGAKAVIHIIVKTYSL